MKLLVWIIRVTELWLALQFCLMEVLIEQLFNIHLNTAKITWIFITIYFQKFWKNFRFAFVILRKLFSNVYLIWNKWFIFDQLFLNFLKLVKCATERTLKFPILFADVCFGTLITVELLIFFLYIISIFWSWTKHSVKCDI